MDHDEALQHVRTAHSRYAAITDEQQRAHTDLVAAVQQAHRAGVNQADLARTTGLHRNTIAAWCR